MTLRMGMVWERMSWVDSLPDAGITTSIPALDEALGGSGLHGGHSYEIFGKELCGKTLWCLHVAGIAASGAPPGAVVYLTRTIFSIPSTRRAHRRLLSGTCPFFLLQHWTRTSQHVQTNQWLQE